MTAPLVSITVPCFNTERVVAEAIRSARDGTYPAKEGIVIGGPAPGSFA